jgi:radical SAM protein with 4Fe4S-binding SPASM domain
MTSEAHQLVPTPPELAAGEINTERREAIWDEHIKSRTQLFQDHPLDYLFLEVTRACNLSCAYCGSSCGQKPQREELSIEEWIQFIRQVAEDFNPPDVMVAVTGGEPLTKPGVFELFAELHRLGFHYGMVSNSCLLDADVAKRLVEVGMDSLSLSMDAPPPLNDRLRGEGTSLAVFRAVEALHQAGFEGKLEIISTITTPAVPFLDQMRALVSSMRVPYWRVAPVMPVGRAARRPDLVPGPTEIRQIMEFVLAARSDDYIPTPEMSEEGYLGNRFEGNVRPYLCQCRAGISIAGILCDGRIGACPELGDAYVQGHIKTDRFRDVWKDRYQVFRDRSWMKKGPCTNCDQFHRCEGGAMHLYDNPESETLRCLYLLAKEGGG